jgi:SagB-type dehydrogenase family enzyme
MEARGFFRDTELDATSYPAWRDALVAAEMAGAALPGEPRSYPGYPRWPLPRTRPRLWASLDRVLTRRRCAAILGRTQPARRKLARLLQAAHGVTAPAGRGPVPSAGGLQALELYLAPLAPGWLPTGVYHYDRPGHYLSQVSQDGGAGHWQAIVPSLRLVEGGSLLWVVIGDGARVQAKYQTRGLRFVLLEAGHLMQNLCLLSASLRLGTVPLGGFFEAAVARTLALPAGDEVLYAGVCGPMKPVGQPGAGTQILLPGHSPRTD